LEELGAQGRDDCLHADLQLQTTNEEMKNISEIWDDYFYQQRMRDGNNESIATLKFEEQCDIVAAMERLELKIFSLKLQIHQLKRQVRKKSRLIKFEDEQPPKDHGCECYLVTKDGSESPSDGGTVHDLNATIGILGWKKIIG
jgi:hypothetical protein